MPWSRPRPCFDGGAEGKHRLILQAAHTHEIVDYEMAVALQDGDRFYGTGRNTWSMSGITTAVVCQDRVIAAAGREIRHLHFRSASSQGRGRWPPPSPPSP
ncbi:hypothetical protein Sros01_03410 [Streptomyces roseochromogenus]|nr:hypothetical protein Sros01_03410 [Streptomyces roseochromogenus]